MWQSRQHPGARARESQWRRFATNRVKMPKLALLFLLPALAAATNAEGEAFLKKNAGLEGVITLSSGMQYKVLRAGEGKVHPLVNSPCECHYEGRSAKDYPDGPKFDSSYDRGSPSTFAPNQVIKGWTEAMQLMVEGDKWEMFIPSDLAYGNGGRPPKIGGGDCLIFTMEIVKIKGGTKPKTEL
jgi:FKBP-type peptidyl-prolyl cis-trans isomerase FklB